MKAIHWLVLILAIAILGGGYYVWKQSEKHKPTVSKETDYFLLGKGRPSKDRKVKKLSEYRLTS